MKRRWTSLAGVVAGVVAALVMLVVMLELRRVAGIATPMELIGDRIAPLMNLWFFLKLIGLAGSYNRLKQFGVAGVLAGELVVGALAGIVYALLIQDALRKDGSAKARADRFLAGFVGGIWAVSVVGLWPTLGTNYVGLAAGKAALANALGLLVSYVVYGIIVRAVCVGLLRPPHPEKAAALQPARRALIAAGAGVVAGAAAAGLLLGFSRRGVYSYDGTEYRGPDLEPITPNDRFYLVTKNNVDPAPRRALWRLEVRGMVQRPKAYRWEDLAALPAVRQETTLECISNGVGGGLISNAIWTGVPLARLIVAAGPLPGVQEVVCRGVDGYADNISFAQAMDPRTLLAYLMNGVPLPLRHGFPARLVVPGMVGEKSIKWVTRIELLDHRTLEFYERMGWGPHFDIHTTARFDAPDFRTPLTAGKAVVLRGIAFAGSRGVERVEISTDDARTWQPGTLTYRRSPLAWVFWQYAWTPPHAGEYRLAVRAVDGTGAVQSGQFRWFAPEGSSGYHRVVARVD